MNGLDMLSSSFNRGTLDLDHDLKGHQLYSGIFEAITNYNSVYKKMKTREAAGTLGQTLDHSTHEDMPDGTVKLKRKVKDEPSILYMDKNSMNSGANLTSATQEEKWPAMQQAKEDVIYEFEVLLGRIQQFKQNNLTLNLPDSFTVFNSF